jgi:GNAT superfamily N-acetyltransferase
MDVADRVAFRTATLADVPAVVLLVEAAYRGESSRAGWTHEADLLDGQRTDPDSVAELLRDPGKQVLLLDRGGPDDGGDSGARGADVVACCLLERHGTHAYFGMFAVRPDMQRREFGSALLAEAERIARDEWGAREMQLTVISVRAELVAWYLRRGYASTGRMIPFPYGDERFGIPRRDDLELELLVKPLV